MEAQAGVSEAGDADIVARVLNGDRDAFGVLVRRHQDMLFAHAVRMTGRGDVAADLVQASLIKAYTHLDRCRNPEHFGAWAFRIVANRCKDYLKNVRRRDVDLESAPPIEAGEGPERDLGRRELRDRLADALGRLPEDQRQAFLMKHAEGRSYDEMAELLGVSIGALKMRVHRARESLMELLEP
jgi:RNA polymerase sigma-70 factor (ECF subfamily)